MKRSTIKIPAGQHEFLMSFVFNHIIFIHKTVIPFSLIQYTDTDTQVSTYLGDPWFQCCMKCLYILQHIRFASLHPKRNTQQCKVNTAELSE